MPGVGIDLLDIERLERALERRPRLAERFFTSGERAYAHARARPGLHLAARLCAKEAVVKALALEAFCWQDIEVVSSERGGSPRIALHGALAGRDAAMIALSLTHTDTTAGAVALAGA